MTAKGNQMSAGTVEILETTSAILATTTADPAHDALQAWAEHLARSQVDYCAVDLRRGVGRSARLATAHRDRAQQAVAEEIATRCADDLDAAIGVGGVLRRGASEHHRDLCDPPPAAAGWDARQREVIERLRLASAIFVPIAARGQTIGVLTLATTQSPTLAVGIDVALAEELARRASLSVENARLRAEVQDVQRSREEMLGIVSHDVRNPLSVVLTGSALLLRGSLPPDKGDRARRQVEAIQRAGYRINIVIRDLLEFASIESGELTLTRRPHDVAGLLSEALDALRPTAAAKSQELASPAPAETLAVSCDRDRIVQVFANVVGNSIKFGPGGAHIRVDAVADGPIVRFTVADDGPGMGPEELANLFDRSWQAQRKNRDGVGLGLAIARGIVAAHGGRLWAESALGEGTRVHFTLAAATPAAAQPA